MSAHINGCHAEWSRSVAERNSGGVEASLAFFHSPAWKCGCGDGSPHVNRVSHSKLIPFHGGTVTMCAGHPKNTNSANGLLLAHAPKNKVTLTNIHAPLVDHVTVRKMNNLISLRSQGGYVVLHHHLRLLSKRDDII